MRKRFDDTEVLHAPGVWEDVADYPLNSGRLTDVLIHVDALVNTPPLFVPVMESVAEATEEFEADAVVPVPTGALVMAKTALDRGIFLPTVVELGKTGKRNFSVHRPVDREVLSEAQNIVMLEDAVTTGGAVAAAAETVRWFNPSALIFLVAILKRSELSPEHARIFSGTRFIIEHEIPSWLPGQKPENSV